MPEVTFVVDAADPETGEDISLKVPARSAAQAAKLAQAQGWLVSKVNGVAVSSLEDSATPARSALQERPVRTIAFGIILGQVILAVACGLIALFVLVVLSTTSAL